MKAIYEKIKANLDRVIYGCEEAKALAVCAAFSEGHLLIRDVPGTGKTELAKALSLSLGLSFRRIQFTPDLLPSDVTGINFYNPKEGEFILRRGPVFANILLADEINRATPRTQAALLECMQERQATVDGESLALPDPFFVIATMNPVEFQGTFPLPEAELDRFTFCISMHYPEIADELRIVEKTLRRESTEALSAVMSSDEWEACREKIRAVHISGEVQDYIVRLIRATRESTQIRLGVSPRGTVAFARAAQTWAAMQGRDFVLPDDVKALAVPILAHRITTAASGSVKTAEAAEDVVRYLLNTVPAPVM
ncbi:MAG: AAA family ATPase [Clostridia bacterium]|nr:AAA family ATPase [Clostridia bacterium]